MRHRFLFFVLALFCALVMPANAYALDGSLIDSFSSGVSQWSNPQQVEQREDVLEESPALRADGESDGSVLSYIQQYVNGARITLDGSGRNPLTSPLAIRTLILIVVPVAVLFVFFWWGVRKAVRMLMSAFRRGRISA